jgi:hypothetical protein
MLSSPFSYLGSLANGINAKKGTENCVHCALRLDKHLGAGENLAYGPVPKGKAHLYLNPLIEEGIIIRSTSTDGRLANNAAPNTDYIEICNLDDPKQKWIIDTTVTSNNEGVRLLKATSENIHSLLVDLPRRANDGTAYGLIVLTHKNDINDGHMINYYVSADNQVYFIDSQVHNVKDQVKQVLDFTHYRDEIFYLPSRPPEGLKIKIEHALLEIKEEVPQLIEEPFEIAGSDSEPELLATKATIITASEFRKLLAKGQLIDSVDLIENKAKFNLKKEYDTTKYSKLINVMFSNVRQSSPELCAMGKIVRSNNSFYLLLNDIHSFKNGNDILEALTKCAAHKQLSIRKALAKGDLIKNVTLNGNDVTLHLTDEYDDKKNYPAIQSAFAKFSSGQYRSDLFKAKFLTPRRGEAAPTLHLRNNHGFKNADEVLVFLRQCAGFINENRPVAAEHTLLEIKEEPIEIAAPGSEPELPVTKVANISKSDFRKLLEKGQLIDSVELNHNEAKLNIRAQYNNPEHRNMIHSMFAGLSQFSPELRAIGKFARRKNICYLRLNDNHSFENGNDILEALTKLAVRKQIPIRKALAKGELIKNLTLEGNVVTLHLTDEYNDKKYYSSINGAFGNLYHSEFRSDLFREKFISPPQKNIAAPTLLLRDNHGFKDADEVHAFLLSCAAPKKKESSPPKPPILHAYQLLDNNIKGTLPSHEEAIPAAMKLR